MRTDFWSPDPSVRKWSRGAVGARRLRRLAGAFVLLIVAAVAGAQCPACDSQDPTHWPSHTWIFNSFEREVCPTVGLPGCPPPPSGTGTPFASCAEMYDQNCNPPEQPLGLPCFTITGNLTDTITGEAPICETFSFTTNLDSPVPGGPAGQYYFQWQRSKYWTNTVANGGTLVSAYEWGAQSSAGPLGDYCLASPQRSINPFDSWDAAAASFKTGGWYCWVAWVQDPSSGTWLQYFQSPWMMVPPKAGMIPWTTADFINVGIATNPVNDTGIPNANTGAASSGTAGGTGGSTGSTNPNAQNVDNQSWLNGVFTSLFEPQQSSITAIQAKLTAFENWGPFGCLSDLANIESGTMATPSAGISVPGVVVDTSGGTTQVRWDYGAGTTVPFNFHAFGVSAGTPAPWRGLLGLMVYLLFAGGLYKKLMPRQQV